MAPVLTFKTARDSRNRITLRGPKLAEFYEAEVFPDGEIRLKPRFLAAASEIVSQSTQDSIAKAVTNARRGKVGPRFDPSKYKALLKTKSEE